jgi:hypothetical protein
MGRGLSMVLVAGVLVSPGLASAQSDAAARDHESDVRRADSLFDAAKALLEGGQYVDACAKFAESKRLAVGLGVTLYLADCYERIGRTASAWTEFRSAEGLARQRNDKRADVARERALAIEPKLDRLTIVVAPTLPRAELQVLRDGAVVPPEEWGVAVPVDPGDHVVAFSAPGHPQRTIPAHVGAEASTATVHVDRLEDAPAAAVNQLVPGPVGSATENASPVIAPPESDSVSPDPALRHWIGIGVAGAGVAGIAVGTVFGLQAKSKLDQSNAGPCDATDHCSTDGRALRQDASGAATVSTIAFAAGAVAVAAGVVIYLTAPRAKAVTGWVLTPSPAPGGGGALLEGAF